MSTSTDDFAGRARAVTVSIPDRFAPGADLEAQGRGRGIDDHRSPRSPRSPFSPTAEASGRRSSQHSIDSVKRRPTRTKTVRNYQPTRPILEPGAEPGIDTAKEDEDDINRFHQVSSCLQWLGLAGKMSEPSAFKYSDAIANPAGSLGVPHHRRRLRRRTGGPRRAGQCQSRRVSRQAA